MTLIFQGAKLKKPDSFDLNTILTFRMEDGLKYKEITPTRKASSAGNRKAHLCSKLQPVRR